MPPKAKKDGNNTKPTKSKGCSKAKADDIKSEPPKKKQRQIKSSTKAKETLGEEPQTASALASASTLVPDTSPPAILKKENPLNFSAPNQTFVTLHVGPHNQTFVIHKAAITHYSPRFNSVFSNPLIVEGQTNTMTLAEEDPVVFGIFNNWLYFQVLEHSDHHPIKLTELTKLWIFAASYQIPELQNDAMTPLIDLIFKNTVDAATFKNSPVKEFFDLAYEPSFNYNKLKKVALDAAKRFIIIGAGVEYWIRDLPDRMVADVTRNLIRLVCGFDEGQIKAPELKAKDYLVDVKTVREERERKEDEQEKAQAEMVAQVEARRRALDLETQRTADEMVRIEAERSVETHPGLKRNRGDDVARIEFENSMAGKLGAMPIHAARFHSHHQLPPFESY